MPQDLPARGAPINYEHESVMREYYDAQGVCAESEAALMWERTKVELPVTFRLTCSGDLALATKRYYDEEAVIRDEQSGDVVARATALALIPDAYSMGVVDRKEMRKLPSMKSFRSHLIADFERGALQRQELVSMIPPIFLKATPQDTVLDMCASPGSKTSQILDGIHRFMLGPEQDGVSVFKLPAEGALLANDIAIDRARLLSHQLGKIGSPLVATICSDASAIPKATVDTNLFTKVLCDVPCSGDGTCRKNYDVWGSWRVTDGLALHPRQLKILIRGLEVLAPGGRLVYSTCSFNPIENEAVVAAALTHFGEDVKLVDVFAEVPELPAARGMTNWKVPNPRAWLRHMPERVIEKLACRSLEEKSGRPGANKRRKRGKGKSASPDFSEEERAAAISALKAEVSGLTLFCSNTAESGNHSHVCDTMFTTFNEEAVLTQLGKTARFLPHHALNSGGFFVAVLERSGTSAAPLKKWRRAEPPLSAANGEEKTNNKLTYDDSLVPVPLNESVAENLIDFYGLSEEVSAQERERGEVPDSAALPSSAAVPLVPAVSGDLRREGNGQWLYQNGDCSKRVMLATPRLFAMQQQQKTLNFITFGAKAFERLDERFCSVAACEWRLSSASAVWLSGFMRRRVIYLSFGAMGDCLERDGLPRAALLSLEAEGQVWNLQSCRAPGSGLLQNGGCVLVAAGAAAGALRVSGLITASGHVQPMMKKCERPAIVCKLRHVATADQR